MLRLILPAILSLPEPIAITSHEHTDIDGAASAYALYRLLKKLNKDVFIYLPSPSAEAKRLKREEREYSSAIVVDTHKPSRVRIKDVPVVVIDHHVKETDRGISFVFPEASSTSEIVALLFKELSLEPPRDVAEALLRGIISDTKGFRYASEKAFEAAAYLRRFASIENLFERREPIDARIASLKALSRVSIYRVANCLIAVTHVSAYESKAASDLISVGADVAIVYSKSRIVVRSRFPLLELAKSLPAKDVGGHERAFVIVTDDTAIIADKFKDLVVGRCERLDETKKREFNNTPL